MLGGAGRGKVAAIAVGAGVIAVSGSVLGFFPDDGSLPVGTTLEDFFVPGTQPNMLNQNFVSVLDECFLCHGDFDQAEPPLPLDAEPVRTWTGSMMAQAARDPVFWAANTIANQDADFGGDLCIRCHSPAGWLGGRSVPTDGSALLPFTVDMEGVACHVCHRMVDPVFDAGNPVEDLAILDDLDVLGLLPAGPGSAAYVIDPDDVRRGPFQLIDFFPFHFWLQSPFHQESAFCGTCHDVSNPLYTRQEDGSYVMNDLDMAHPTGDEADMFPIERTYGEWLNSQFAAGGVQMNGRFGGPNHPTGIMESCQDCHMPDQVSPGCRVPDFEDRPDMPAHFLNGGNTWVLNAVDELYTDGDPPNDPPNSYNDPIFLDQTTGLTREIIDESLARATAMLQAASDMELTQQGNRLNVRVTNFCGHKLPTGYHEGRRMWVNVKYFDGEGALIYEHGGYDFGTAELDAVTTKVYEAKFGLDAAAAAKAGLPAGESFHFILNNTILFDNRIPPIGFTNAGFESVQAEPVGYSYADGQHWDDTAYIIPPGAEDAVVTLYHQTTSKEYIEFLRDENVTDSRGQIAYDQWETHGRSAPVDLDSVALSLDPLIPGDLDNDGVVGINDFLDLLTLWGPCPDPCPPFCLGDIDGDCVVGITDFLMLLANWG